MNVLMAGGTTEQLPKPLKKHLKYTDDFKSRPWLGFCILHLSV